LEEHEAGSFWFRSRNKLILWALKKHFPYVRSYLEGGCGTGYVLSAVEKAFPLWRIAGLDPFVEGLRVARKRTERAELFRADLRNLPWDDEFDLVGVFDVLEHLEDDQQALSSLRRALRPGGGILVTVPQHPRLWNSTDDMARHVRRYRRGELEKKMESAGFRVVYSTAFIFILLPFMVWSRRGQTSGRAKLELGLPAFLDRILEIVLWVERLLIFCGFRFPVGGSRLVVGRRTEG
jgi:SAM-dependent methyltransferase